jgi:hypothetical protein
MPILSSAWQKEQLQVLCLGDATIFMGAFKSLYTKLSPQKT